MLPLDHPDRIQISFDDHRLVANAGLILPVTLAQHLGLRELVQQRLDLAIAEFLSVDPKQRRAFALELLPVHLSEQ